MASNNPFPPTAQAPSVASPTVGPSAVETAPATPVKKAKKQPPYRKLPGRMPTLRVGASGIKSLYLGDDHLLLVDKVFFVEHYKRFAYADIQALVLRQTVRGLVMSIVLAVMAAGFGVLGWSVEEPAGRYILWGIAAFFGLLLIVNLGRGPTCRCQLETAVGPQPLLTLSRLRPARKAFALIIERITATQGEMLPADAAQRVDETLARLRQPAGASPLVSRSPAAEPRAGYHF